MKLSYLTIVSILALAPALQAQTGTGSENQEVETTAGVNTFANLSPGNQMIARSLMDAQVLADSNADQIWTLDQIAAARAEAGWGKVFHRMQAEGLITARNLGQVVSSYARDSHRAVPEIEGEIDTVTSSEIQSENETEETGSEVEITGAEAGDTDSEVEEATDVESEVADTEVEEDTGTEVEVAANDTVDGTFNKLSPGNQKVARALMDAQILPADDTTQIWTLDQIAAAKAETGWGEVFHRMQSEGLVTAKNLGHVIRHYDQNAGMDLSGQVNTTASGSLTSDVLRSHGKTRGNITAGHGSVGAKNVAYGVKGKPGHGVGLNMAHRPIGNVSNLPVSASHGITTATGANVSISGFSHAGSAASHNSVSVNSMAVRSGVTTSLQNSVNSIPFVIQSEIKHGNALGHGK